MVHNYEKIISVENLCLAWGEFIIGKKKKSDVLLFSRCLMDNIVELHECLVNRTYRHGGYQSFYINDPKRRHIHKAGVRDRLLHHAVYRILYPFFDRTFIADSYSCRNEKGTHKAINRFRASGYKVSRNHTITYWVLKCDIRKFFASINHQILFNILSDYISDADTLWLLRNIIDSFYTPGLRGVGLPLGNLTSQLFANIYMNRFDHWAKHFLKAKQYIRYADDFVFLSSNKQWLQSIIPLIQEFLQTQLKLSLHPDKVFLKTSASGVDFLGWAHFPYHRILRQTTKQRMMTRMRETGADETIQSYLGLLRHGNTFKLQQEALTAHWLNSEN